ncbi:ROK family protein [Sphingobium sp. AS12]|uniref:ROK family transcriptional regulator n=1 Tax=Sphingobium sp. AS12 TaxID=2849495 RepID=UPI001C3131A9|nr:ROK family transcriptional regulator [Sphingobium sp. AS12]MBV2149873.1 ROK family protein [Sphingobium sp. AS12]
MNGPSARSVPPQFFRDDRRRTATPTERSFLALLQQHGSLSQADIGRATDLTAQSVMRIADALMARNLIQEGSRKFAGRGKPATLLHLNSEAMFSIGLSLMTDALSLILLDFTGEVRWTVTEPLLDARIDPTLAQMRRMIDAALSALGIPRDRLVGAGVGITGYFVNETSFMNPPALLEPWALVPIDEILTTGLDLPVWIDNDGNFAAVAEAMSGVGRTTQSFAYLFFSTGFGGGIVVDGKLSRGQHGNAGEFASVLPHDWPQPNLERLRQTVNEHGASYESIGTMLEGFSLELPGVAAWIGDATRSLNLVISAISGILDPGAIVLGGRLPQSMADALIPHLRFTNPPRRGKPRPVPTILGSAIHYDATALGAASTPLRDLFFTLSK